MLKRILSNRLAILCAVALLLVPTAMPLASAQEQGGAPRVRADLYPQSVDNEVLGIALDATGRYGAAVVKSSSVNCPGLLSCPTRNDWYGFDFGPSPRFDGLSYSSGAVANSSQLLAVSGGDGLSPGTYFAVAGAGNTLRFGRLTDFSVDWTHRFSDEVEFKGIALSRSGDRLAILYSPVTKHQTILAVYHTQGDKYGQEEWRHVIQNEYAVAMAIGRESGVLGVATTRAIYGFSIHQKPDKVGEDHYRMSISNLVTDIAVSSSASSVYIAAVTEGSGSNPGTLRFVHNSKEGFAGPRAASLHGHGSAVAISGDGSRIAAGTTSGRLFVFERGTDGGLSRIGDPLVIGQGRVTGAGFSSNGNYLVASVDSQIVAFHRSKPADPLWAITGLPGAVTKMAYAENGRRIVAATADQRVFAYDISTRGEAFADHRQVGRDVEPNQVVPYSFTVRNTGNTVDQYDFHLRDVPAGWQIPAIPGITVDPGREASVHFNATTRAGAEPGAYSWFVESTRRGDPTPIASLRFFSNITHVAAITVDGIRTPYILEPGDSQSFTFSITNRGNADALVNISDPKQRLTPPGTNWGVTVERDQVVVPKGETVRLTGNFNIPRGVPKGTENRITLEFEYNGLVRATFPITVRVAPDYRITMTADKPVVPVEAGGLAQVQIRLTNNGNTDDIVTVTAMIGDQRQTQKWTVTVPQSRLTVSPGEPRVVAVNIEPAVDAEDTVITISAQGTGGGEPQILSLRAQVLSPDDSGGSFIPGPPLSSILLALGVGLGITSWLRRGGGRR